MRVFGKFVVDLIICALLVLVLGSWAMAATMVRHEILTQYTWDGKQGFFLEVANDQTKDGAIAPLKTATLVANLADGEKWMYMGYTGKWELGKDYVGRIVVKSGSAAGAELWLDGKKRTATKVKFMPFDSDPILNGVPDWASGEAAYKVLIKSLVVKTANGNDYEAEFDPASFETGTRPVTVKDWRLGADDLDFTIDFTFSFAPVD